MRRLPLVTAVALVALISVVGANAYKQAITTNGVTVTVDTTTGAQLALTSASPLATVANGVMRLDFQQGNGSARQLQSTHSVGGVTVTGDKLQMRDVFRITNNGASSQCVSVYVSSGAPANLTAIYGRLAEVFPGTQLASSLGAQTANRVLLAPGGTMKVDFHWDAVTAAASSTFAVTVASANQVTCP